MPARIHAKPDAGLAFRVLPFGFACVPCVVGWNECKKEEEKKGRRREGNKGRRDEGMNEHRNGGAKGHRDGNRSLSTRERLCPTLLPRDVGNSFR